MADRCFVAVEPPAALVARLRALDRPARPGLRWTPEGQWHVTLKFFPAVDRDALVAALDARAATDGFAGAEAVAGPMPRAMSRRVWMVPVEGLEGLAAAVEAATADLTDLTAPADLSGASDAGAGPGAPAVPPGAAGRPPRPFRGHLTLARARNPSALRHLAQPDVTIRWPVPELVAVRSDLTREGARHEVIGRWPLPG